MNSPHQETKNAAKKAANNAAEITRSYSEEELRNIIWSCGIKATEPRVRLLLALMKEPKPLSVAQIHEKLKTNNESGTDMNISTIYRSLELLQKYQIVRVSVFKDNLPFYEFTFGRPHHHHIFCSKCGRIENVFNCSIQNEQKIIIRKSKNFNVIASHSLEFFGICKKCFHT